MAKKPCLLCGTPTGTFLATCTADGDVLCSNCFNAVSKHYAQTGGKFSKILGLKTTDFLEELYKVNYLKREDESNEPQTEATPTKAEKDENELTTEIPTIRKTTSNQNRAHAMTKLQCELCGSVDIVKESGLFVCQHCGCKYSLEEAKSLLLGSVKIDRSDEFKNLMENAMRAINSDQHARAESLLEEALNITPDDPNCNFWYGMEHALASDCKPESIGAARDSLQRAVENAKGQSDEKYAEMADRAVKAAATLVVLYRANFENDKNMILKQARSEKLDKVSKTDSLLDQAVATTEALAKQAKAEAAYDEAIAHMVEAMRSCVVLAVRDFIEEGKSLIFWDDVDMLVDELEKTSEGSAGELIQSATTGRINCTRRLCEDGDRSDFRRYRNKEIELREEIEALQQKRKELGMFKKAEKASIDEQIQSLSEEADKTKSRYEAFYTFNRI